MCLVLFGPTVHFTLDRSGNTCTRAHASLCRCEYALAYCSEDEGLQLASANFPIPPPHTLSLPFVLTPPDGPTLLSQLIEPLPPPTAADRPCHCHSTKVRAWQLKLPTGWVVVVVVGGNGGDGRSSAVTSYQGNH